MHNAENLGGQNTSNNVVGEQMSAQSLDIVNLGPNNVGAFGPDDLSPEAKLKVAQDLGLPEYSRRPSSQWICVDGRCSQREIDQARSDEVAEADPQIAGSLPVSESAADLMAEPNEHQPLSYLAAKNTRNAAADGQTVIVHGDEVKQEDGCAANAQMRSVLDFNAQNADVVAPTTWFLMERAGLHGVLEQDDVTRAILNGQQAADNDALWDVTPREFTEICKSNGAQYEVYKGAHHEKGLRVSLDDDAFAKAKFADEHSTEESPIQAFSASAGHYAKLTFERAQKHGWSERDAALKIMRVVLYNIGISKKLVTEAMDVSLISPAQ